MLKIIPVTINKKLLVKIGGLFVRRCPENKHTKNMIHSALGKISMAMFFLDTLFNLYLLLFPKRKLNISEIFSYILNKAHRIY